MSETVRRRVAGFTLVELLVALALVGIVTLLLVQGIGLAALGFDRVSRGAERLDESRGVDQVLRRTLGSAAAVHGNGPGIGFSGDAVRVSFLSLVADSGAGLYRVDIALDVSSGERRLVVTRRLAAPGGEPRAELSILARGVSRFRIAYFGVAALGEEPAWHDRWDGLGYLPNFMRIELDAAGAPARPPLIVRVWNAG
ncbi:MAG TPA: prepilin-type N-terminal cleavage/methylation domain-containing protein [Stellaceae bacterium]|jgi:general secretion pathway protein J|nr:prepilin-type N-terminal cleavage/methylation domain-containing protein [Stellaceae bacterium]